VQVIAAVAVAAGTTPPSIRHCDEGAPRMLSARLGCYEGMRTLRQIALALRLLGRFMSALVEDFGSRALA
jgi:hypothetical protein